ncbi:MAG TPA: hypothetical protein PLQ09_07990 [Prolixibacteraceae bacterium]|nr:hypothetical protein [Prolixibacteraceae bacterium]
MRAILYIGFPALLLLAGNPTFSQTNIEINGRLQYDHISYFDEMPNKVNSRNEGFLQVEFHSPKGQSTQWKAVTEVREDLSDKSRNRVWMDELLMKQSFGKLDITAGKQLISWGTTDGMNPVNNINPIDYSDLLDTDDERIGVYGLRSQLFLNAFDIDLFWSPVPATGKLPTLTSRWFPSAQMMGIPAQLLQSGATLAIADAPPALKLNDGEIALRIRKQFTGFDLALSYFNGYDHLPEYTLDASGMALPSKQIVLRSEYRRQQVAGAEIALSLPAGFGLRGESALFIPEKGTAANDSYLQTVVGIDKSVSFGSSSLLLIAQYIYDYNIEGNEYAKFDVRHLFKNSIMANAEWSFNNSLSLNVVSVYNIDSEDFYLKPEISYTTPGGLKFLASADLLEGPNESFLGSYTTNDRIQCKVVYQF